MTLNDINLLSITEIITENHTEKIAVTKGDMFTTEEISLSQLCSLPCVTGTTGRISPQWKSQTALDMIKHRPKHRVAIFLKNIVQNIASLSKKCDIFTGCFRQPTQKQR